MFVKLACRSGFIKVSFFSWVLLCAFAAQAAAPVFDTEDGKYAYTFPYYVVDAGEGATVTLKSDAVIMKYADAEDEGEAVPYADFLAAASGTFFKTGVGTLKIDAALTGWEGQIHVIAGRLESLCAGSLGKVMCASGSRAAAADATYVHNGATIYRKSEKAGLSMDDTKDFKMIVIEGAGTDGRGALVADSPSSGETNWPLGYDLVLTGDAVVRNARDGWALKTSWSPTPGQQFTLNGHRLTFFGDFANAGSAFLHNNTKITAGCIVASNLTYKIYGADKVTYEGDAANTLKLTGGSVLSFNGGFDGRRTFWTLVPENVRYLNPTTKDTGDPKRVHAWIGSVNLVNDLPLYCDLTTGQVSIVGFTYGAGGFPLYKGQKNLNFHLSCPSNSFAGPVGIGDGGTLHLHAPGALPAAGAGATIANGTLTLYGTAPYALPEIRFSGTGCVHSADAPALRGTISRLTKMDDGELVYDTRVGATQVDIQGGAFKFEPVEVMEDIAGLYEGYITEPTGSGANPIRTSREMPTNQVRKLTTEMLNSSWPKCSCLVDYGYIWNRSSTNETWNFFTRSGNGSRLFLDTTMILDGLNSNCPYGFWCTVQMTPGPHYFEARYYSPMGSAGVPALAKTITELREGGPNGTPTPVVGGKWVDNLGLAFDPLGRCEANPVNFRAFTDPGDGSVMTVTSNATEIAAARRVYPDFARLSFAPGTALDMSGKPFELPDLVGCPAITSGDLTVTNSWTVDAAQVAAGAKLTASGAFALGDGAKIVVTEDGRVHSSPAEGWTLAEAEGGLTLPENWLETAELPADGSYSLKLSADGKKLSLVHQKGLILLVR